MTGISKVPYIAIDPKTTSTEAYTPPRLFTAMGMTIGGFMFHMDVCSPGGHITPWIPAKRFLTLKEDGLKTPWLGFVWLKPPYGIRNGMQAWLDKFLVHGNGLCLLPDATDTGWFQDFTPHLDLMLFVRHRLQFMNQWGETPGNNPRGSMLGAIGPQGERALCNASANGLGNLYIPARPPLVLAKAA
jgi:hypothetical protein